MIHLEGLPLILWMDNIAHQFICGLPQDFRGPCQLVQDCAPLRSHSDIKVRLQVFSEMQHLSGFFADKNRHKKKMIDLYESVLLQAEGDGDIGLSTGHGGRLAQP